MSATAATRSAVMVPFLQAAGHPVHGLDLGLNDGCDLGPGVPCTVGTAPVDMRDGMTKDAGVPRFLFSLSCRHYRTAGSTAVAEDAEFHPVTAYGEAKVLAERELAKLAGEDAA